MKHPARFWIAAALLLAAASAASAGEVTVKYQDPDKFVDVPFWDQDREQVLKELTAHFQHLARQLPPNQQLQITVTDLDLAGRVEPRRRTLRDIRVLRGGADWPTMELQYTLEQDGKVIASKKVQLTVPPCRNFVYAAKFVCGTQPDCPCECTSVRPGKYSTVITVHNHSAREVKIGKRVIPVVFAGAPTGREPAAAGPRAVDSITLPPLSATMDDCCRLAELLFGSSTAGALAELRGEQDDQPVAAREVGPHLDPGTDAERPQHAPEGGDLLQQPGVGHRPRAVRPNHRDLVGPAVDDLTIQGVEADVHGAPRSCLVVGATDSVH